MRSLLSGLAEAAGRIRNRTEAVPYTGRAGTGLLGLSTRNDAEAQMQAMSTVGTLFAIVSRLADSTAEVQWLLWRKAASGKKEDRTVVTSHAALDLWNKPNPFYRRRLFTEAIQQHQDLVGESWWVVLRSPLSPLPLELWPVRPDRMRPVPDPETFLRGYVYCSPDGEKVPLGVDDVIHPMMPNPLDPYRGLGPVQALMTDIDSAKFGAQWNRNFFINGAQPGGVVEVPERLEDDEFDELVERWREQHQGVANAHRVAVLERGTFKERKFSMRDMQFTELRNISREQIREAYGYPKGMLGTVDDVNRANAEAGEVMFARWLVQPRLERLKDVLNFSLLPMYGKQAERTLEWDYLTPIPKSREDDDRERDSKSQAWAALVAAGADPDDASDTVGLPRMRMRDREPTSV